MASPTHDGATISMRSAMKNGRCATLDASLACERADCNEPRDEGLVRALDRCALEPIARAAIRTHRFPVRGDLEEYPPVAGPQRHCRIRAMQRQIPLRHLNDGQHVGPGLRHSRLSLRRSRPASTTTCTWGSAR